MISGLFRAQRDFTSSNDVAYGPSQSGGFFSNAFALGSKQRQMRTWGDTSTTQYEPIAPDHWTGFGSWGDTNYGSGEGILTPRQVSRYGIPQYGRVRRGGVAGALGGRKTVLTGHEHHYFDLPRYDRQADRRQTADVGYSPFFISGSGGYQPLGQRHQRSAGGHDLYGMGGAPMLGLSGFGGAPSGLGGFGGFGGGVQGKLSY